MNGEPGNQRAARKTVDGFSVAGVLLVPLALLAIGLPWPLATWGAPQIISFAVVSGIAGVVVAIGSIRARRRPGGIGTMAGPVVYLILLALAVAAIVTDQREVARRKWLGRALGRPSEIWHACNEYRENRGRLPHHIGIALREGIIEPENLVVYASDFNVDGVTVNGAPLLIWLDAQQETPAIEASVDWIEVGDFLFARQFDEDLWMNQEWIFAIGPPSPFDDDARAVVFGGGRRELIRDWAGFRAEYNEDLPPGFAPIPDRP